MPIWMYLLQFQVHCLCSLRPILKKETEYTHFEGLRWRTETSAGPFTYSATVELGHQSFEGADKHCRGSRLDRHCCLASHSLF